MKIRLLVSSLLLALAFATPALRAQDSAAPAPTPAPAAKKPKTALEKQMDKINKSVRALKKQIADPSQNDSSLTLVTTIHDAAVAASKLTPAKASDFTGDDHDKFIADYQAGMKDFIDGVDQLTAALQANDNDAAQKALKHLTDLQKKDHKQFRRPEKDKS